MIDRTKISDAQKLFYLKTNVVGETNSLVNIMSLNLNTYSRAWKRMCEKYDNNLLLSAALADRLFSQQSYKEESAEGLRSLKDFTKEVLASLKHIGIDVSGCEPIIIFLT